MYMCVCYILEAAHSHFYLHLTGVCGCMLGKCTVPCSYWTAVIPVYFPLVRSLFVRNVCHTSYCSSIY